tara:strand:- start:2037 stop:3599 length:1563 start_codon:yes stop_codon:yes gene_type:complete
MALLEKIGLCETGPEFHNLSVPHLYREILQRSEAILSEDGAIVAETGTYTGRSPDDKFIVREPSSEKDVWWGDVNRPFLGNYNSLFNKVATHLANRAVFVQDLFAGADPDYRLSVRVITELAWHNLFARNMFIRPSQEQLQTFEPDWHLIYTPGLRANPQQDKTRSETFVVLNFHTRTILIGGTHYAGELKKSVFTLLNYVLPKRGVLSMHCSANKSADGASALFFGLSGTGKTTLSASSKYQLIGDDEHGWNDRGIFNFEGGCYAKAIRLNEKQEPQIYAASHRFGSVLENVVMDKFSHVLDLDDDSITENTRSCYPLDFIPNASVDGLGGHPRNVIMLTCDAFGVLPPVSKLSTEQAMYHFISGYTAKVAGTERGVRDPIATFSPCFGAPFLVLHPTHYARQLGERLQGHGSNCWLVNTGWNGGMYGEGSRISIAYTRAIVAAILDGQLDNRPSRIDPVFGLQVPKECSHVPVELLDPRTTWRNPNAYDEKARELAGRFNEHFTKYASLAPELRDVAP